MRSQRTHSLKSHFVLHKMNGFSSWFRIQSKTLSMASQGLAHPFPAPTSHYHSYLLADPSPFANFDPDRFAPLLPLKHVKHMCALESLYSLPGLSGKKKKNSPYYNHLASFLWLGLNFSPKYHLLRDIFHDNCIWYSNSIYSHYFYLVLFCFTAFIIISNATYLLLISTH